jgi:F0F1-type ATP synthase epsilon subunit
MDAYCHGRGGWMQLGDSIDVSSLPHRTVTEDDYQKLVQQYRILDGMHQLHQARINVLRERQAKQAERISNKQEQEMRESKDQMQEALKQSAEQIEMEERTLRLELAQRKARMRNRWELAEKVERRKLELEKGLEYGELPGIEWPEDGPDGDGWRIEERLLETDWDDAASEMNAGM